jgi:hypothetical protein
LNNHDVRSGENNALDALVSACSTTIEKYCHRDVSLWGQALGSGAKNCWKAWLYAADSDKLPLGVRLLAG